MKKRIISILLCVCMLVTAFPIGVSAANSQQTAAVNYIKSLEGQPYDVDNGQYDCVDLAKMYFRDIGGKAKQSVGIAANYAKSAYDYTLPTGWVRKYYSSGYRPQPGDVAVWDVSASNPWGHVALIYAVDGNKNTIDCMEQNTLTQQKAKKHTGYSASNPVCYIVPTFNQHTHTYNNYVCSCGDFQALYPTNTLAPDNVFLVSSSSASLRNAPYTAGNVVRTLSKGTELTTVEYYTNKQNEVWYKVNGYGDKCYIKGSDITRKPPVSSLSIDELKVQNANMEEGSSNRLLGYICSNYSISNLQVYLDGVLNSDVGGKAFIYSNDQICPNLDFSRLNVGTHTIRVIAYDTGGGSKEASVSFTVKAAIKRPSAIVTAIENGKQVCLTCETEGTDIYYTLDGSMPTAASKKYETPLFFDTTTTINVVAIKNGKYSANYSHTVIVLPTEAPEIVMDYTPDGTRVSIIANEDAKIFYSLGEDYYPYTSPLMLTEGALVYAFAEERGCTRSETNSQEVKVARPDSPVISNPIDGYKFAQGKPITLQWNNIYNAGSYLLNVYFDGSFKEQLELFEPCAVYIAEDSGEYSFTVSAKNVIGVSDNSSSITALSIAPKTVSFIDWDGTISLSEKVDYNSKYEDIQKPSDPERRGYTFLYWGDRNYSVITEDLEIEAKYKINTYTVTFYDQDGNRIDKPQTIEFDKSASAPDASSLKLKTGYALLGWNVQAESALSLCDYSHVDSNMSVRAIVGWEKEDLPVVAEIISAQRDEANNDGNYIVSVQLTNYPNKFTTALLRVSLKTAEDKMVKTESRTVGLKAGATDTFTFTLNYEKTATVAEAVALGYDGDYLTGAAYSEAVTKDVTVVSDYIYTEWSELFTEQPEEKEDREIEAITQYSYSRKSTTSANTNTLSGWTLENAERTSWGTEQGPVYSDPTNETRKVRSEQYVASTTHHYKYYHKYGYYSNNGTWMYCWSKDAWASTGERHTIDLTYPLSSYWNSSFGETCYRYYTCPNGEGGSSNQIWFYDGVYDVNNYATRWYYQEPVYTYYFYQWSDYSDWQNEYIAESDTVSVQTRVVYRYRDKVYNKIEGVEDRSGEFYTFSNMEKYQDSNGAYYVPNALPTQDMIDLSGRKATVMVYKGKNSDPNESQLQYVGQIDIEDGNMFEAKFKTKDIPTLSSGDYVVCMGVEGSTGLINIGIISAPKETYNVNYYDIDGNKIGETQIVEEGKDAIVPTVPVVEGYNFVTWSESGRNVHDNLDITAIYSPITYAVVFIDWQNGVAIPYALPYGTDLTEYSDLLIPSSDGYEFLYWDKINEGENTVTENMVISAVYEPEKYTVNFYDSNGSNKKLISSQQVEYGKSAQLPDVPAYEDRVFIAWDTCNPWWDVTNNVDVFAITAYNLTSAEPTSSLGDLAIGMIETLELYADENAQIYYTIDGTDPIPGENGILYVAGIQLSETTQIRAVATEDGKNNSDVIIVDFYYDEGFDGEYYDDTVTIGTYEPIVKANDEVSIMVNINNNPGLLGSLFFIGCDPSIYYIESLDDGSYKYTAGDVTTDGMYMIAPYEGGWKVLWFGTEAATGDGSLFTIALKVNPEAMSGTYPVTVSYSASNMLGDNYAETKVNCEGLIGGVSVRGDINSDGDLTLADVIMILRHVVGLDVLSDLTVLNSADVNRDGEINVQDALRLARYIAGLETVLY